MSAVRFLNVVLLLGLGASLALGVPRLWSRAPPDKAPEIVAPSPVPPPLPSPSPSDSAWQPRGARDPWVQACYERVRRKNPGIESEGLRLRLTIGISGRVKYVGVATPPSPKLRPLLPCIRGDVARWTFPPNEEEYAVDINVSPPRWR